MRKLLVSVVFAVLLWPAAAQAGWKINRAVGIANVVWGDPCSAELRLDVTPLVAYAGYAGRERCLIEVSSNNPHALDWVPFCYTVLHEMGHLAGYRDPENPGDPIHSHNPRSVMNTSASPTEVEINGRVSWVGGDRRCRENGRPYLERHGLLAPRR